MKRFVCALLSVCVMGLLSGCGTAEENAEAAATEALRREQQEATETKEEQEMIRIQIGEHQLNATLEKNSSTEALLELLSEGPMTISMSDYASMEKVGPLPTSLPTNDEPTQTEAGDLILYLGRSFVIYYDTNSWNFTRLGKIENVTAQELRYILGDGDVTAMLTLAE